MKKYACVFLAISMFFAAVFPHSVCASSVVIFPTKQYGKNKGAPVTYTDVFPALDLTAQYTLHVWQGDNGLNVAENGSIALNGTEVVSSGELRNSTGYITKPVVLQGSNALSVSLKGKSGVFLKVQVTGTGGNLPSIAFTSPANGAMVNSETVMVTGTIVTPEPDVAVTVNGKAAQISGGSFFVNGVSLAPGQNTLTAKLTEASRYSTEEAISVQSAAAAQRVTLIPNMEDGISPLTVDFLLSSNLASPIISYELDVDGNGVADYSGTGSEMFSHNYPAPGVYFVQAIVRDAQNGVYTDVIGINVFSRADMDTHLQAKWSGMKNALMSGNPAVALAYFSAGSQEKYNQILGGLDASLPALAANMRNIELIYAKGGMAKYRITRDQDVGGAMQAITYYIYFIKDRDGFWKIRDF